MLTSADFDAAEIGAIGVDAVEMLLEEVCCCKSSVGICGTGLRLIARMLDAAGLLTRDVEAAAGPLQRLSWLNSDDDAPNTADIVLR